MQAFFVRLGVEFDSVRAAASQKLFEVASLVIRGAGLPAFPEDTHPFESERAQDDMVAFALGLHVLVILLGPGGIDHGLAVSISIFGGVKIRRHVREEQRPTAISPKRFQAHQRLISLLSPKLARAVESDLILSAGGLHCTAA